MSQGILSHFALTHFHDSYVLDVTGHIITLSSNKTLSTRNTAYKPSMEKPMIFVIFHFATAIVMMTASNIANSNTIEQTSPLLSTSIGLPKYIAE